MVIIKKDELETGMVVKLRSEKIYLVMRNCNYEDDYYGNDVLVNNNGWLNLKDYNDDMTFSETSFNEFDIMEVYKLANIMDSVSMGINNSEVTDEKHLIFKRPVPRKMTKEEIETILGYKVEIV